MSLIMVEYICPDHGRFESLESRPAPSLQSCPDCGEAAELTISAPLTTTPIATVVRGHVAPRENPYHLDTSAYGLREQGYNEWRKKRNAQMTELRRKEIRSKLR
jgi:hypothetical protein